MAFRTLEISQAAEIHIHSGQLIVETEEGIAQIPVEDLSQIMLHGANIRLSTMDLSILSKNKVAVMTLDEKYLPTALVLPFDGHSRQSKLMHVQVRTGEEIYQEIWMEIVKQKIRNQSRALSILGLDGAESVSGYLESITEQTVDQAEACSAKEYFSHYHVGMNRRAEEPINSRLNYGYAVVRSAIARCLVSIGFHPTFGIHHSSQLNAFNLADDLMEPYRPMVDLVSYETIGSNLRLNKAERRELAHVLHNACAVEGTKVNLLSAIEMTCESLKRIILEESSETIQLPVILPVESMEGITE